MTRRTPQTRQKAKRARRDDPRHRPVAASEPKLSSEGPAIATEETRDEAEPGFLSRGQVSRLFGVSVSTVTRWARLGLVKTVRTPGGHYRFPTGEMRRAAERAGVGDLTRLD